MRPEFYLTLKFLNQACIPTQQKAVVSRALSWKSPLESCALPSSSPAPRRIQLGLTQVTGLAPSAAVQTATPPGTAQWDAAECTEPCPGWTRVTLLHTQYCSENAAAQRGQVFDVTTFPNICKMLWFDILLFEKGTTNSANTISAVNHPCDRLSLCSNTFSSKCWERWKLQAKSLANPCWTHVVHRALPQALSLSVHPATSLSPPLAEVPGCPHLCTAAVGALRLPQIPFGVSTSLFCHTGV